MWSIRLYSPSYRSYAHNAPRSAPLAWSRSWSSSTSSCAASRPRKRKDNRQQQETGTAAMEATQTHVLWDSSSSNSSSKGRQHSTAALHPPLPLQSRPQHRVLQTPAPCLEQKQRQRQLLCMHQRPSHPHRRQLAAASAAVRLSRSSRPTTVLCRVRYPCWTRCCLRSSSRATRSEGCSAGTHCLRSRRAARAECLPSAASHCTSSSSRAAVAGRL
mmetsp:Transcript_16300/g.44661  ORF Transcript_16300/g.44661 Transcript_16300/m.44661 type:complete len:216 (-) Transcript_16300:1379-2026(-)